MTSVGDVQTVQTVAWVAPKPTSPARTSPFRDLRSLRRTERRTERRGRTKPVETASNALPADDLSWPDLAARKPAQRHSNGDRFLLLFRSFLAFYLGGCFGWRLYFFLRGGLLRLARCFVLSFLICAEDSIPTANELFRSPSVNCITCHEYLL